MKSQGFSLLEITVVVSLMVIIAGTLMPVTAEVIQSSRDASTRDRLTTVAMAVEAFAADTRAAPFMLGHLVSPEGEGCNYGDASWRGPYVVEAEGFKVDAWGSWLSYERRNVFVHEDAQRLPGTGEGCYAMAVTGRLTSSGADRNFGSSDDLVSEARVSGVIREVAVTDTRERLKTLRAAISVYAADFYSPGASGWGSLVDTEGEWWNLNDGRLLVDDANGNQVPVVLASLRIARLLPDATSGEVPESWPFNGSDRFLFDGFGSAFQVRGRGAQVMVRSRFLNDW